MLGCLGPGYYGLEHTTPCRYNAGWISHNLAMLICCAHTTCRYKQNVQELDSEISKLSKIIKRVCRDMIHPVVMGCIYRLHHAYHRITPFATFAPSALPYLQQSLATPEQPSVLAGMWGSHRFFYRMLVFYAMLVLSLAAATGGAQCFPAWGKCGPA